MRNVILLIVLSTLVIFTLHFLIIPLHLLEIIYLQLNRLSISIFANHQMATMLAKLIFLIAFPVVLAFVIRGIYSVTAKKEFAYQSQVIWGAWLVSATLLILINFIR